MAVSDEQVMTMRAMLAGDFVQHRRMFEQLEQADRLAGYEALLAAAFLEAVDRRFGEGYAFSDVIQYVADARARYNEIGTGFDPRAAERLIRAALGDGSAEDLGDQTLAEIQVLLLGDLITSKHLGDAELDQFMNDVRNLADESLS